MLEKSIKLTLFLAIPISAYAFSISHIFPFLKNATPTTLSQQGSQSTVQNLQVFESKKVFADSDIPSPVAKDIVKDESVSFDPSQELQDQISDDESKGDNAVYTVQKNDSIYSIASYFGVSVQTIVTFNHMSSKAVHPGDVLEVPSVSGILYTVGKGDTLANVSKKYNVDSEDILLYNGLSESDALLVGDELFLPGAKGTDSNNSSSNGNLASGNKKTRGKNILTTITLLPNGKIKGEWANGDTAHLNSSADISKYSSLPKFAGYFLMPAPGAVRTQKMHGHNGVDLANKEGSPILAAADGIVTVAKTGGYNFGYGNYIRITHSNGTETLYGHLEKVLVSQGQSVTRGQQIAQMGMTGNATGPHLHFEIRGAYNPFAW